ncbi:MAG: hypothetical protein IME96_07440 [Proteobacteria bacterium]|nr:hypothetical protein [Pseudomonadota bacterium]
MMNSQIDLLNRQETDIIRKIQGYEKLVKAVPANEQKLADIQRDYEISLKNYQSLLEKKNSASLAENLEKRQKGERFRVIDPANLPGKPFKPNIQKIMLLGTIAGGGMGIGLVLLLELLNPVFRKTEDLDDILPWPVMAAIPDYSEKNLKKEKKILKKLKERRI